MSVAEGKGKRQAILDRAAILSVSVLCISLELFFTRILNLKTWNHVVYVIIPFAILGYGIGVNLCMIFQDRFSKVSRNDLLGGLLCLLAVVSILTAMLLIQLPVTIGNLLKSFQSLDSAAALSLAYAIVAIPFAVIGFFIVYLFMENPKQSSQLYFWNLLGSGLGAVLFFFLIYRLQVFRSITLLCLGAALLSAAYLTPRRRWISVALIGLSVMLLFRPEPSCYAVDPAKHWEWIPGYFSEAQYEQVLSKWHPYGRTDAYRFKGKKTRQLVYKENPGTFQINVTPLPEFTYFCTNFLAGSPVYKLSKQGMEEAGITLQIFSQPMEFPYLLFQRPKVVVIGTGGGRDIFMAKTHGATEVAGAEINPVIYAAMSKGGELYEYSGRVYELDGVRVVNLDGRQLVKRLPRESQDLIVLNGVDTFSGLSTGAYAYAESYLYTKEAIQDYLRILRPTGMVNLNRWFFRVKPRETLRLFVICLDALQSLGVERPWEHIMIGYNSGWGMTLVKRTPFTSEERAKVTRYFREHDTELIFPTAAWEEGQLKELNWFEVYVFCLSKGNQDMFLARYPFDVSVVTDDSPFFYKYYRFIDLIRSWKSVSSMVGMPMGTLVFFVQLLVLAYAVVFTLLAIIVPLALFQKRGIRSIPAQALGPFVAFFGCLGVGYMFIEIATMQRFTVLLGSPIYSISVSLAALLSFSGLGSAVLPRLQKKFEDPAQLLMVSSIALTAYLFALISLGTRALDVFMGLDFIWRVLVVTLSFLPLGFCLGLFFPTGLQAVSAYSKESVAWAFGINCGFTVLGSMLAILLAQFLGFHTILLLAAASYLIGSLFFKRMRVAGRRA